MNIGAADACKKLCFVMNRVNLICFEIALGSCVGLEIIVKSTVI